MGRFFRILICAPFLLSLAGCDTSAGRLLARGYNISPVFLDDKAPPNSTKLGSGTDGTDSINPGNATVAGTTAEEQPLSWDDEVCQSAYHSYTPQWTPLPTDCAYLHRGFLPPVHLKSYTLPGHPKQPAILLAQNDKNLRNALKDVLIERSNRICASNKAQIAATKDTVSFGLGASGALAGGVGGVVSGVAANVMSSVSGLMSGLEGLAAKDYWQSAMDYAIMQQITTAREAKLKEIDALSNKGLASFTVAQMLRMVSEYHEDCSFTQAVTTIIQNAAGNQSARNVVPAVPTPTAAVVKVPANPAAGSANGPDKAPLKSS